MWLHQTENEEVTSLKRQKVTSTEILWSVNEQSHHFLHYKYTKFSPKSTEVHSHSLEQNMQNVADKILQITRILVILHVRTHRKLQFQQRVHECGVSCGCLPLPSAHTLTLWFYPFPLIPFWETVKPQFTPLPLPIILDSSTSSLRH